MVSSCVWCPHRGRMSSGKKSPDDILITLDPVGISVCFHPPFLLPCALLHVAWCSCPGAIVLRALSCVLLENTVYRHERKMWHTTGHWKKSCWISLLDEFRSNADSVWSIIFAVISNSWKVQTPTFCGSARSVPSQSPKQCGTSEAQKM